MCLKCFSGGVGSWIGLVGVWKGSTKWVGADWDLREGVWSSVMGTLVNRGLDWEQAHLSWSWVLLLL